MQIRLITKSKKKRKEKREKKRYTDAFNQLALSVIGRL
jgi:hypothetical protein